MLALGLVYARTPSTCAAGRDAAAAPWRSGQAGPQVAGADGDDQDAEQAADQRIGKTRLKAGPGIGTGQAADTERDADGPVRGHRARLVE